MAARVTSSRASVGIPRDLTARCEAAGVPVVLFNCSQGTNAHSAVTSDNFAGGKPVAAFFTAASHESIAYFSGREGASTQRDREAEFRAGFAEAIKPLAAHALGEFNVERAKDVARVVFDAPNQPDAVFVATDHMAFAVRDVLRSELGLRIPQDISVVG